MSPQLTVAWDRVDVPSALPLDSSQVLPASKLTVAWGPVRSVGFLDYELADLGVTPGAGADPGPAADPAPPGGTTPTTTGTTPAPPGTVTTTVPVPTPVPGAPSGGGSGATPALPGIDMRVAVRRTSRLFRADGLAFTIEAPRDAKVRAVLTAEVTVRRRTGELSGPVRRKLTRTRELDLFRGVPRRITLRPSIAGRRFSRDYDRLRARLEVRVVYRGQSRAFTVTEPVTLVERRAR